MGARVTMGLKVRCRVYEMTAAAVVVVGHRWNVMTRETTGVEHENGWCECLLKANGRHRNVITKR